MVTGLMLGCSTLSQLRVLCWDMLALGKNDNTCQAFALMLRSMVNLNELSKLKYPTSQLWDQVHVAGGHSKLQKLGVSYSEAEEMELEAMVRALVRDFPALITLELELINHNKVTLNRTAQVFLGLKRHSTMTNLTLCLQLSEQLADEVDGFFRMLQQELGPQITLTEAEQQHVE
jgi:hypothetical protein